MTTIDSFFTLKNVWLGRGEETPQFEAILVIKGRDVAYVKNRGTGGSNSYQWIEPFSHQWAEKKLLPVAVKVASAKEPEFADLYSRSASTALDSLVFDAVETYRFTRGKDKIPTSAPQGLKRGATVEFGRENGEKTRGRVLKINKKSVLVETLEDRGSRHVKGAKFRVHPSLVTVVS